MAIDILPQSMEVNVSAGVQFSNLGEVVQGVSEAWLKSIATALQKKIRAYCRKKSVQITASVHGEKIIVKIVDPKPSGPFTLEQWAFGENIYVPPGGFKPPPGKEAWYLKKPHERAKIRARIYNRAGPALNSKVLRMKGFGFAKRAIEDVFKKREYQKLAKALGAAGGRVLAQSIRDDLKKRGLVVGVGSAPLKNVAAKIKNLAPDESYSIKFGNFDFTVKA